VRQKHQAGLAELASNGRRQQNGLDDADRAQHPKTPIALKMDAQNKP
jgi:hypothetical protein